MRSFGYQVLFFGLASSYYVFTKVPHISIENWKSADVLGIVFEIIPNKSAVTVKTGLDDSGSLA